MDKKKNPDLKPTTNETFAVDNPLYKARTSNPKTPSRPGLIRQTATTNIEKVADLHDVALTRQKAMRHFEISKNKPHLAELTRQKATRDIEKADRSSIEMTPNPVRFSLHKNDKASDSPESTISTSSQTSSSSGSSDEDLSPVNLFPEESLSIANRIVKQHELCYMAEVPEKNEENLARYKYTSIITPTGLHQINREFFEFRPILTSDELHDISPHLTGRRAHGQLMYDGLTLEQLNLLERKVIDKRGHSVIGYSINEEVFLKIVGLGQYEYPPLPQAYPKRLLDTINMPVIRDLSTSLRFATQSLMLFKLFANAYLQYASDNEESYNTFFYENVKWLLVYTAGITAVSQFLLQSNLLFKREDVLPVLNRLRLIEESLIGNNENWTSYGSLVLPPNVIGAGIAPVLLYALKQGLSDEDEAYTTSKINIFNHTKMQTFLNGLSYSLTTGSFFYLGLKYFVGDLVFAKDMDDERGVEQMDQDLMAIQYAVCAISLLAHLARYPNASAEIQNFGRYASNISNALGNVMLDNYATFIIISMVIETIFGLVVSPEDTGVWSAFYSLQALTMIYTFLASFPVTPDLPEFSNEFNPSQKDAIECCKEKFNTVKEFFFSFQSCNEEGLDVSSQENDITHTAHSFKPPV